MNSNEEVYTEPDEFSAEEPKEPNKTLILVLVIGLLILAISIVYIIARGSQVDDVVDETPAISAEEVANKKESRDAILGGILGDEPAELQNLLLDDLKSGVNDKFTKTHAYFVTHRFYDNGGDIYEIYNYVNSYPELAFLKEAESIYPEYFDLIKNNQLPKTYTDRGNLANMAYAEVLEKNGYGDTALLGTIANQYSKTALFLKLYATQDADRADMFSALAESILDKANLYALKARPKVAGIMDGMTDPTLYTAHDAMVGLNQYAASLRYLKANGITLPGVDHDTESAEVFAYTARLAQKEVTELVNFTALLDASTLYIAGNHDIIAVSKALEPIHTFDTAVTKPLPNGAIDRIIKAKNEVVAESVIDRKLDVYSKTNIVSLASSSPDFREWLFTNGWTDDDLNIELSVLGIQ